DIGSRPDWHGVPGAAEHTLPIKPVDGFLEGWEGIERSLLQRSDTAARIVIVGGGAGGTELSLALQHRLAVHRGAPAVRFAIVTDGAALLPEHNAGVRRRLTGAALSRGVELHLNRRVIAVDPGRLRCRDGGDIPFDAAIWVTNAAPAPWLREAGLATDERGFVAVNACLQSRSHPFVFAAGDVAAFGPRRLAKSGVVAVRQGPPLARNLRLAARGETLEPYRPQRHHLALISTGDRYAVASRGRWSAAGRYVWKLKDLIDRRWMRKYQDLDSLGPARAPRITQMP
ncbi:MAG TPA: FAD-dependent oxidoreductase, partial [Dongiaceae bacterium]